MSSTGRAYHFAVFGPPQRTSTRPSGIQDHSQRTDDRIDEVVAAHLQEAAIVEALLALPIRVK
jgi:hypothetical protein